MTNVTALKPVENIGSALRKASAKRIATLMQNWTENTLDLGKELTRARDTFPQESNGNRPGWHKWIKDETGLSPRWATTLVKVADKFGSKTSSTQKLSINVLELLASDKVPEEARQEVMNRAEAGEKFTREKAKEIADKHRLPSPKAANTQAKDEGRPVLASDGYIYFGADPAKAKEGEDRRTMVYGVRRALDTLGSIELTGTQFLNYALPHQLWTAEEGRIIKHALRWLTSLDEAWDKRK